MAYPHQTPRRRSWGHLGALALAVPLTGALQPAQAATILSYISSPYRWVGSGESVSVRPEDGFAFSTQAERLQPNSNSADYIYSFIDDFESNTNFQKTRFFGLTLSTPGESGLNPGTYSGATRYADPSAPVLDFWGNGRSNNTSTGSFTISEISYHQDGSLSSLAVDFLQYGEGDLNNWIKGALRLNSSVPIALTPEPFSEPVIDSGLIVEPVPLELLPDLGAEPEVATDPSVIDPSVMEDIPLTEIRPMPWERGADLPIYFSSGSSMSTPEAELPTIYTLEDPATAVPAPLPMAGALAFWQSARRLRRRCQAARARTTS
jgi:hypothetical protein